MATTKTDDRLEKRVVGLEKDQELLLNLIKGNSDLISEILKRERIQLIALMLLALSQLLLVLKPIIHHLLG